MDYSVADFLTCPQRLPPFQLPLIRPAGPIRIEFLPNLTRRAGKLFSGAGCKGVEVHAGSFLRERRIVLESALLGQAAELRRILIHELFHFIWMRLGNRTRNGWREILTNEANAKARGELGWSAESRKGELLPTDSGKQTQAWRDYACESFCDTAAWRHSRIPQHDEFTLGRRWKSHRAQFFDGLEQRPLAL